MKKFEAKSLEEAYRLACDAFDCSMTELSYEIVQYPSQGVLGFFAKPAIIVAARRAAIEPVGGSRNAPREEAQKIEAPAVKTERAAEAENGEVAASSEASEREAAPSGKEVAPEVPEEAPAETAAETTAPESARGEGSHEEILDRFFAEEERGEQPVQSVPSERELQERIESELRELMERSCFDIDVVEVDVIDKTAYIFLDGEDAALLIGKEGYRYNALSYLLFNWLHGKYQLFIKLEIAQFLSSQQEMIRQQLQPVIEHVEREGWGRTRPLDGILVQIALEQLREAFPNKYVAIKHQRDGGRYVLINEFNSRRR
jgi:spoIIIJ-associated protein